MASAAALAVHDPQADSPGSNSSEQRMLSKTVVGVAQVMLAAHMNAEKSATDDGENASKDPVCV